MAKFHWDKELKMMVDGNGQPMIAEAAKKAWKPKAPFLMLDIGEFVSPIDDVIISSRSQLREHEKKHNVIQVGSDLKAKRTKKREKFLEQRKQQSDVRWIDPS